MTVDEQITWLQGIADTLDNRELRLVFAIRDVTAEVSRLREVEADYDLQCSCRDRYRQASDMLRVERVHYKEALEQIAALGSKLSVLAPALAAQAIREGFIPGYA